MIITCPHCNKEHHISDEKIPSNAKKAKCNVCGNHFQLSQGKKTTRTKLISVCLTKGGVGKTTTAVNLSAGLAQQGYKVLLVDTDTQGQVCFMLGVEPPAGLTELLTQELGPKETIYQARDNLWILAGGRPLAGIKRLIDRQDFGGEMILSEAFKDLQEDYDFIIFDTSPGWDSLTVNVLFYVNEILLPVSLEAMTIQGLVEFHRNIAAIQKYRKELTIKYIVPTFMDMRVKKKTTNFLNNLKKHYHKYLCPPIRYNNSISQTPKFGKTIFEYDPNSKGASDYKKLVDKVANST